MTRNQHRYLEFLVFKCGGVAGAIRRIVYRCQGIFTSSLIHAKLLRKYPLLVPNHHQLIDCLKTMEMQKRIQCVLINTCGIFYKLAPRQQWFQFS